MGIDIDNILCLQAERIVTRDNCVSYQGKTLQIPKDRYRYHYIKATVRVHEYTEGGYAIFHGPRHLASYDANGQIITKKRKVAA